MYPRHYFFVVTAKTILVINFNEIRSTQGLRGQGLGSRVGWGYAR